MNIRILDSAIEDLLDGFSFYENQQTGLGAYFLDSLFSDIDCLQIYAGIHPLFFGAYHRLLAKRFPFAVYYRLDRGNVQILAVLDCRRDPAWVRTQLTTN